MMDPEVVKMSTCGRFATFQAVPPGEVQLLPIDVFREAVAKRLNTQSVSDETFVGWVTENKDLIRIAAWQNLVPRQKYVVVQGDDLLI